MRKSHQFEGDKFYAMKRVKNKDWFGLVNTGKDTTEEIVVYGLSRDNARIVFEDKAKKMNGKLVYMNAFKN